MLLIEHLAQLVDNDPTVAAIKALRAALADLGIEQQQNTASRLDEIQARRTRRRSDAAAPDPAGTGVQHHRR